MNNQNFQNIAENLLKNQNNPATNQKVHQINNMLKSNQGKDIANQLNKMANSNQNIQNVINSAKMGDINSATKTLSTMMNTKDGQELAKMFSKIMGE